MAGQGRPGPESRIAQARGALDKNGREVLDLVVDDPEYTDQMVADALNQLLADIGSTLPPVHRVSISEWRRGQPRDARRRNGV